MEKEPLKDKIHRLTGTDEFKLIYFEPEDIKSAVEWLKEEIRKEPFGLTDWLDKKINKAFQDVMKKEKKIN